MSSLLLDASLFFANFTKTRKLYVSMHGNFEVEAREAFALFAYMLSC